MNSSESARGCSKIVEIDKNLLQVRLKRSENAEEHDTDPKAFTFDAVFDDDSQQSEVYDDTAYGLVRSVLDGYNGTIFACLCHDLNNNESQLELCRWTDWLWKDAHHARQE